MNFGAVNFDGFLARESYLIEKASHSTIKCIVRFSENIIQIRIYFLKYCPYIYIYEQVKDIISDFIFFIG